MNKGKSIVNAVSSVALITLVAKLLGFVREALQGRIYDQEIFAAYANAYTATDTIYTTVGYALCVAAIPIIAKMLNQSREDGFKAANNIFCVTVGFSVVLMVISLIFPYSQLLFDPSPELILYSRILTLTLPVVIGTYLFVALLQNMEHYTIQGALSLPYNALLIVFLVAFGAAWGLKGLAITVAIGWLLQMAMTIPLLIKEKYRFRLSFDLKAPYMGQYVKTAVVTVLTTSIYLFCYVTDMSFADGIGEAASSGVYFADKFFTPVATLLVYSITIVMFPKFNLRYLESTKEEYRSYVWNAAEKMIMLMLPLSIIFAVFATPIVKVLFEGANFTVERTTLTGQILTAYLLGTTGFAVLDMLSKAYFTMNRTLHPLVINIAILGLNLVLNYVLVSSLDGYGLALATSAALTIGALAMLIAFFKGASNLKRGLFKIIKSFIATAVMAAVLFAANHFFVDIDSSKLMLIIECVIFGVIGVVIFFLVSALLGEREMLHTILKRLKREK